MLSRRDFFKRGAQTGLAAATTPLWSHLTSQQAFGATSPSTDYKAIILITLYGGNDGNNTLIPFDSVEYSQYAKLRGAIALNQGNCHALKSTGTDPTYGVHPSLPNVAKYYNNGQAMFVANIGPLVQPATKAELHALPSLVPASLLSHTVGLQQWESSTTEQAPSSGWGGRIADIIASDSGRLPPILNASADSLFTVGHSVQGIVIQSGGSAFPPLPVAMQDTILRIAKNDTVSKNAIVAQAAQLRVTAMNEQQLLVQAQTAGPTLKAQFPNSPFGKELQAIAQVLSGKSVIGAKRQIFYVRQGSYDTHAHQLESQGGSLADLDAGLDAMMQALEEMGLSQSVLICTHSDFNRSMQSNVNLGSDHAWGNHHMILGGGISGGRIAGTMPALELGGSSDLGTQGIWIPTTSVTQMTAGIGLWMGLTNSQVTSVFPDLSRFPAGAVKLS